MFYRPFLLPFKRRVSALVITSDGRKFRFEKAVFNSAGLAWASDVPMVLKVV